MFPMIRRGRLAAVVVLASGAFVTAVAARQGVATPPPQAQAQPAVAEGSGAISGVVVDGTTGRALAGAVVTLTGRGAGGRGIPATRMSTDDKGRFIFTKLPAAESYLVAAARIGFSDARNNRPVALADGQWYSDAKISMFKLGAISGVLTDEANEPVVGAPVRVLTHVMVSGLPQIAAGPTARTDDRGVYRIAGLTPGKYLVVVPSVQSSAPGDATPATLAGMTAENFAAAEAAGRGLPPRADRTISPDGRNMLFLGGYVTPPPPTGRAMAYPITFYPAARSPRDAAIVELKNGEDRSGIDLQLRPVPVVRVSGTVEGPAEAEATGMSLRLMPAGAEGLANGSEAATALVAPDGSFTFLNVPAGDYTLIANRSQMEYQVRGGPLITSVSLPSPPGATGGSSGGGTVQSGSTGAEYSYRTSRGALTYSARLPVTVGTRDLTDVVVPLKRAMSVSGRFVYEMENPPTGPGRGALPAYAEPADGNAALGMLSGRLNQTAAETTFTIDGLQPGLYTLRFLSLGAGGRIKSITLDGKDFTNRPLDASGGHDLSGIVVTVTDKATRLNGYVRDAQNQMATHGSVICFPVEPDQWSGYGFSPRRISSGPIGSNGAYTFGSLPAGSYNVIAVDESLATAWQDPKFLAAAAALAAHVTLAWGDSQAIDVTIKDVPGFKGSGVPGVPRF